MSKAGALARLGAAVRAEKTARDKTRALTQHALLDAADAGASLTELGEQMGINKQTVRWHLNAAREATGRTKRPDDEE